MLQGLRIIEIEGLGPAPFAAMMLADLGADVICVHRRGGADAGLLPSNPIIDRGKRSITLDLKSATDVETLLQLIESADGLIEGFRPGVMERLGLGPSDCHARNPGLIYGRMTGWGQDSPLSQTAGHDLNYIALSGALWYDGLPDAPPLSPPTLVGDIGGGALYLVAGMLAAVLARDRRQAGADPRGCVVDAAIYDGSAHMMNLLMTLQQAGHFGAARGQNLLDGPHWSRCYTCADGGHISVQCLEPQFYAEFLRQLGLQEDPAFTRQHDKTLWPVLAARLAGIFVMQTRDHWAGLFFGSDACVAPVLSPSEASNHPMNQRGTWVMGGTGLQAAPAPRFSGQANWTAPPSPTRGQHTGEILDELNQKQR
ncbi:CaiB/BaiF CoA transferase family protein [Phaeobacter porticola]|uniref:Alpha-methylacyl-CoA racemase n=1 Tax=Phaeobacter porticola TaxID=1844006 RepID=A0A1L3I1F6_9RHOB|nr:CaiB/BaiF CoA-transferase family protein [Phaeobacter porticola]APG45959.1 alpha-methylacyl-CoA racemase [Phaeobacter porticola]